jgi:hypothetical protein
VDQRLGVVAWPLARSPVRRNVALGRPGERMSEGCWDAISFPDGDTCRRILGFPVREPDAKMAMQRKQKTLGRRR